MTSPRLHRGFGGILVVVGGHLRAIPVIRKPLETAPQFGRLAGVDGVKTGYTRTARQTLVGTVTRDGHRLIAVVLRSPDRAYDGTALLNWGFQSYAWPAPNSVASSDGAARSGT